MQIGQFFTSIFEKFRNPPTVLQGNEERNVEDLIGQVEIFSQLEPKQIRKLARHFHSESYQKGETMFKKGDMGLSLIFILSGEAEVYDEQDGKVIPIATVPEGGVVGEMSLIDEQPRSASVRVLEDTDCLLITRDRFNGLVQRDPEIVWGIVPFLSKRLREANEKFSQPVAPHLRPDDAPPNETADTSQESAAPVEPASDPEDSAVVSAPSETGENPQGEENDEMEPDEVEDANTLELMAGLSSTYFTLYSAAFMLGTQEVLRVVTGDEPMVEQVSKSQELAGHLQNSIEENLNAKGQQAFQAFQSLMSALMPD